MGHRLDGEQRDERRHDLGRSEYRLLHGVRTSEELYDHAADPHEWTNLAGRPEHAATLARFRDLLPAADAAPRGPKADSTKAKQPTAEAAPAGDEAA